MEPALAILVLLARLSAPRPLGPDMERWFYQDRSRLSRATRRAAKHIFEKFHHTLCFDTDRLKQEIVKYCAAVAIALGFSDEASALLFHTALFVDGHFFNVAKPLDG